VPESSGISPGLRCPMCLSTGFVDAADFGCHVALCDGVVVAGAASGSGGGNGAAASTGGDGGGASDPAVIPGAKVTGKGKVTLAKGSVPCKLRTPEEVDGMLSNYQAVVSAAAVALRPTPSHAHTHTLGPCTWVCSHEHVSASSFAVLCDIAQTDDGSVDIDMVVSIIMHICSTYSVESGSVLVFLPGWDEIVKVRDSLVAQPFFSRGAEWILSLHSAVPSHEQRKAFTRPPVGVWKIVLATNIAETSITIDDVVYVVDCGLVKEVR
jgi:hypothetical protein